MAEKLLLGASGLLGREKLFLGFSALFGRARSLDLLPVGPLDGGVGMKLLEKVVVCLALTLGGGVGAKLLISV